MTSWVSCGRADRVRSIWPKALACLACLGTADAAMTQDFHYFGPEAETVFVEGLETDARSRAAEALSEAEYYSAFAVGPRGGEGLYTGAHDPARARDYALAACGADCRIIAYRQPLHRSDVDGNVRLNVDMARGLAAQWPFKGAEFYARGGATAWGYGHSTGKLSQGRASRRALAECEARLAKEERPRGVEPRPCEAFRLSDIHDQRPKPTLYPAAFMVDLAELVDAGTPVLTRREVDAGFWKPEFLKDQPKELFGARAASPDGASATMGSGGWPGSGEVIALQLCGLDRRFGDAPCVVTDVMEPATKPARGFLAVYPSILEAHRSWQGGEGAGAFAIGPLGDWGSSHGFAALEEARQKAADWCLYHTRRNSEFRVIRRSFLEPDLSCRVVDERIR